MEATVSWVSVSPVKGMRMQDREDVRLNNQGVIDDRRFFLVDDADEMISSTRVGALLEIVPEYLPDPDNNSQSTLSLTFPDGSVVTGPVECGEASKVSFYGLGLDARPVAGPFSAAISEHCGVNMRLVESPSNRNGVDRGAIGGATVLGTASLKRLEQAAAEAGQPGRIDQRRFRMNFGIDGIEPHEEDNWLGRAVDIGPVRLRVREKVGRCALTTRDPELGCVDLKTLHHIRSYREHVPSQEPLPFGVYASVERPGTIRLGDPVLPLPA
jgi:uncharacterized protein YcbX